MKFLLSEVARILGAAYSGSDVLVTGWSIDSRTIQPGDLFFAIKGDNFDGHAFVRTALDKGAIAVVVSEPVSVDIKPAFAIENSVSALGKLAHAARERWKKPLIGVTGSAGKTGTKDIIAALLATRFAVGKTIGNLNNHIGLPLSLLRVLEEADLAVLEMGMNHAGEIRTLAEIARPDVGVVTNVGYAHIEAFASIDGIAAAKRELVESLPSTGTAVLNADDPRVLNFRNSHSGRTITYGVTEHADLRAEDIQSGPAGSSFRLQGVAFTTMLPGRHAVLNILAGMAVASIFGIEPCRLVEAVAALAPAKMRGLRQEFRGMTILDDCYNSNPEAARGMLDVLTAENAKRKIAVLGEMLELGSWSERLHRELGEYAARRAVDVVIGIQGAARFLVDEAARCGLEARFFNDAKSAGEFLRQFARPGDAILFKGSRGAHVEQALARMEG